MIRVLRSVSAHADRDVAAPLRLTAMAAVVQGIGFALLVPFTSALLRGQVTAAGWWLAGMVGVLGLYAWVQYRAQLACYAGGERLAADLYEALSRHIVRLPLGWFGGERVGQVSRLMSKGVIDVMGVPAHLLRPIVGAFVTPATVLVCMFLFDWRVALAAAVGAPCLWGAYRYAGVLAARAEHAADAAGSEANGRLVEFARMQAVLRAYDRGDKGAALLHTALERQHATGHALLRTAVPGLILFSVVLQLCFTGILGQGVLLVRSGALGLAELVALLVLAARFMEPMVIAADLGASVRIAGNTLQRMRMVLDTPPLPEPGLPEAMGDDFDIAFDGVRFVYGTTQVLRGVTLHAKSRAVTALVGPSGAGKSTLLQLAARFRDVDAGNVRVAGADVRNVPADDLMRRVSFVFQSVYLYDATIEENLRIGNEHATDAQLAEVIRRARIDEMLERLPLGLATRVGEGGTALSGGERQRIAIGRAMLKDAPILLLDEATAALDPENQRAVQQAIDSLRGTRTIVVIAHRLQTIRDADHIVVLGAQGTVVDAGRHEELLERGGLYADFWRRREQAQGWRL